MQWDGLWVDQVRVYVDMILDSRSKEVRSLFGSHLVLVRYFSSWNSQWILNGYSMEYSEWRHVSTQWTGIM